jgi:peptide/nickel transport system permease protein
MIAFRYALRSWTGRLGFLLVGLLVLAVAVSYIWVPHDPGRVVPGDRWLGISAEHWFGTDGAGKDIFANVLVGLRVSLFVAAASALIAGVIGLALGVISAITPRYVGEPVAYFIDVLIAVPTLVLALVLVGLFKGSLITVSAAIGFGSGVVLARIVRAEVSRVLTQDYIMAAQASGTSTWRTVRRHILPNIAPIAIVQLSLVAALAILAEASLSYLGLTSRSRPSLGITLGELQTTATVHPGSIVLPGIVLVMATLGFNLLGDGLRDATDPRLRTGGPTTSAPAAAISAKPASTAVVSPLIPGAPIPQPDMANPGVDR